MSRFDSQTLHNRPGLCPEEGGDSSGPLCFRHSLQHHPVHSCCPQKHNIPHYSPLSHSSKFLSPASANCATYLVLAPALSSTLASASLPLPPLSFMVIFILMFVFDTAVWELTTENFVR
jgi:hypothetical protein